MDRFLSRQRRRRVHVAAAVAACLVCAAVARMLLHSGQGRRLRVSAEHVTVAAVERGVFVEYVSATGAVVPISTHYLEAHDGGRVAEVHCQAGALVTAGDPIVRLENSRLLLDVMLHEADLVRQENDLRATRILMEQRRLEARRDLLALQHAIDRQALVLAEQTKLAAAGLIARRNHEEAARELDHLLAQQALVLVSERTDSVLRAEQVQMLETSLDDLQVTLRVVRQDLEDLVIRAPIDGQLTALDAQIGQSKSRGERLGQVDRLDGFKLRASIGEHHVMRIHPGLAATLQSGGALYRLEVERVYPQVVGGRFEVDLRFDGQQPEGIRRGQSLQLRLELSESTEALLLPNGACVRDTGGRWVFVVEASGRRARRRDVKLGRQNPTWCEVIAGLAVEERVITSSYENFGDADVLMLDR